MEKMIDFSKMLYATMAALWTSRNKAGMSGLSWRRSAEHFLETKTTRESEMPSAPLGDPANIQRPKE